MDQKLQIELIKILKENGSILDWTVLDSKVKALYFSQRHLPEYKRMPDSKEVIHQLSLLVDIDAVEKMDYSTKIFYRLKPWGHKIEEGGIKMFLYWVINKNHNAISFFALLLAVISFIISLLK